MNAEKVKGVALLLVSSSGKIWTIRERLDKPIFGKKSGDWSIPMETREPDESDLDALKRLLREEVGVGVCVDRSRNFAFLREIDIRGKAVVAIYLAHFVSAERMMVPEEFRAEVGHIGWRMPEEILSHRCREGVRESIEAYHEYRAPIQLA